MPIPPLVAPNRALPEEERERTARQLRLPEIGEIGQRRLLSARVVVVGAGGLGSPVLQYLASAGVGTIGIIDDDVVDTSNLQRQVLFGIADIGRPKSEVAEERIAALSPRTEVIRHSERITSANALKLLGGYDLVIDGTDTFDTRYSVADACDTLGVPLVWGSVLRFDAQATVFWSRPPVGNGVRLRDVFPTTPLGGVESCATAGVLGSLCGQLGGILATEAVKLICGIGEVLLGRILVLDALSSRTREIALRPGAGADAASARAGVQVRVSLEDLAQFDDAVLLDVREPDEFGRGTIPGARSVPLGVLCANPAAVTDDATIIVFCEHGPRARVAAAALQAARPAADVRLLDGGYASWRSRVSVPGGQRA